MAIALMIVAVIAFVVVMKLKPTRVRTLTEDALLRAHSGSSTTAGVTSALPASAGKSATVDSVTAWLIAEVEESLGVSIANDKMAITRIRESAEKVIQGLVDASSVDVNLPYLTATAEGPKHFTMQVTRSMIAAVVV